MPGRKQTGKSPLQNPTEKYVTHPSPSPFGSGPANHEGTFGTASAPGPAVQFQGAPAPVAGGTSTWLGWVAGVSFVKKHRIERRVEPAGVSFFVFVGCKMQSLVSQPDDAGWFGL